jgi:hypothetical protein
MASVGRSVSGNGPTLAPSPTNSVVSPIMHASPPTLQPSGPRAPPRRRQAAVDFESDSDTELTQAIRGSGGGGAGGASTAPRYDNKNGEDGPEWRDRYRQCFMNLPCRVFHTFVLVATLFLLAMSFLQSSSTQTMWYQSLEGVIILIFVTEVSSRLYIARSHFWVSKVNVIEAGICAVCVVTFAAMVGATQGGSREEHEVIMGMRYIAQLLRISVFYKSGWRTVEDVAGLHLAASATPVLGPHGPRGGAPVPPSTPPPHAP